MMKRFGKICFALCMMASLAFGSASACLCSHHAEKVEELKTSCHGSHDETPQPKTVRDDLGASFTGDCTCSMAPRAVVLSSKTDDKKQKQSNSDTERAVHRNADLFIGKSLLYVTPDFRRIDTYQRVYERGKPTRGPPRL